MSPGTNTVTGTIGEYFYDGDGKRVKKYVPSTGEVTVFVYDAAGKQIAEYSTIVETTNAKVGYLTNDHLGSPRINTDANGAVTSRHDYHPFGEEIATSQRTAGLGYVDDSVRKQFTGYERDNETELDFANARYFSPSVGRFSSPDDFRNDTTNVDPQSWNLYAYVRNNPVNSVDPTGGKARVTSQYDEHTNTTTINISASFAVYGANGQNVSPEDLAKHAAYLAEAIAATYNTGFAADGSRYVINTQVTVEVFDNEEAAMNSGADNLVELGTSELRSSDGEQLDGVAYGLPGENFDRMRVAINPAVDPSSSAAGYVGTADAFRRTYAHEFGHLLGTNDKTEGFMQSDGLSRGLEQTDFLALFGPDRRETHAPAPPSSPRASNAGLRYAAGRSSLYANFGMNIIGSQSPSFMIRRAGSQATAQWVARNR